MKLVLPLAIVCLIAAPALSQITFPYTVSANPTASLDVNTSIREPINPMHLSMNYGPRDFYGFNSTADTTRFRRINPPSTRWPIGVWVNGYHWGIDSWETDTSYPGGDDGTITQYPTRKYRFPGYNQLYDEVNFDVMFSFNVDYDSQAKEANRIIDRFEKGFDFKWIELGNETFWKDQRSWATETAAKYVGVAQNHAAALKAEDPHVQIAVPATWREMTTTSGWNDVLDNGQSYVDAITAHKYIRCTGVSESVAIVNEVMKAGVTLKSTADAMGALFPGKPEWYTGWGVTSGDNALSVLGMSDMFLTFSKIKTSAP